MSFDVYRAASVCDLSVTGRPFTLSVGWDDLRHSMLEIRALDRVNPLSAMVAAALLTDLQAGGGPAPSSSVDPDGDVVLTWYAGARKGSAVVAEDRISAVVTNGARVEYVSPEVNVVDDGAYRLGLFSKGVVKWMPYSKGSSLSSTTKQSGDILSRHIWAQADPGYKAFTGTQTLSSSSLERALEWSLSSGTSTQLPAKR